MSDEPEKTETLNEIKLFLRMQTENSHWAARSLDELSEEEKAQLYAWLDANGYFWTVYERQKGSLAVTVRGRKQ